MQTDAAKAFSARMAHWTSEGLSGEALYTRLASDEHLPANFDARDLAVILGISPLSVKKARQRGSGPSFFRTTCHKGVRYPRDEFCRWLASRFVKVAA